jgi:DNA-binding Lrp family transcriptional regulator
LDIKTHIQALTEMTACKKYLYLPSVRTFKRKVHFTMNAELPSKIALSQPYEFSPQLSREISFPPEVQRQLMSELQKDLPLSPSPFIDITKRFAIDEEAFFHFLIYLKTSKKMSRFAGIVKHRNLGFTANAMVVWNLPNHLASRFGEHSAAYQEISHAYERLRSPEWPYNMYTMIHGTTQALIHRIIDELASKFTIHDYEVLYSGKEYKKQRVDYFSQEVYEWDEQHVLPASSWENPYL